MKPRHAFELAITKKEKAANMYMGIVEILSEPDKKKIFEKLAETETKQRLMLKKTLTNNACPEKW